MLPGVYAQADIIEDPRSELAKLIEEYVFVSLQEGHPLPEFKNFRSEKWSLANLTGGLNSCPVKIRSMKGEVYFTRVPEEKNEVYPVKPARFFV